MEAAFADVCFDQKLMAMAISTPVPDALLALLLTLKLFPPLFLVFGLRDVLRILPSHVIGMEDTWVP